MMKVLLAVATWACLLMAGMAAAQTTSIDTIQTYDVVTGAPVPYPIVGSVVTVQGTLYVTKGSFSTGYHYIQDAYAGIQVFNSAVSMGEIGDRIQVTGTVGVFNGEIEIINVSNYSVLSHPGQPIPIVKTVPQLSHWTGAYPKVYDYESVGRFIRVYGTVAKAPTNNIPTSDKQFSIAAGGDTLIVFVNKNSGIDVSGVAIGDPYQIDGACIKYTSVFSNFLEIKPRSQSDLVENPPPAIANHTYIASLDGHHYYESNGILGWHAAQDVCAAAGGYLATVGSAAENNIIVTSSLRYTSLPQMIGFTDEPRLVRIAGQTMRSSPLPTGSAPSRITPAAMITMPGSIRVPGCGATCQTALAITMFWKWGLRN